MNVDSPDFLLNPYLFYDKKRLDNPFFKSSATSWTLTSYDAISKVLVHPAIGRGNVGLTSTSNNDSSALGDIRDDNLALQILEQWMLFQNPPRHTESRKYVADVFTIKMIDKLESLMRDTMRQLIFDIKETYSENEPFDLINHIAYPYPAKVICEMIGIPDKDQKKFAEWTRAFSVAVQIDFLLTPQKKRDQLNKTAQEVIDYFDQLITIKKTQNDNDLISRLIRESNEPDSHNQLLANCVFLLFAGQETTTSLISNAIQALLTHPDQLARLRVDPSLINNTIEECLRYDPSIQMAGRVALDDVEINTIKISKGDHIFAFLGAAGRDPEANSNPHEFDITRDNIKHLAFARGIHHCLGASLARLELKVMLEEFLDAFPSLTSAGQAKRRPTWLMRGFDQLPLMYQNQTTTNKQVLIKLPSKLYPFRVSDLQSFRYRHYQLDNVFETITDEQRHACVKMWLKSNVLPSKEIAWQRSNEVCYMITDTTTDEVIGVNTLYRDKLPNNPQNYFFNRMFIQSEHRNTRVMITGTAAMLCYAKHFLSEQGVAGIININENPKLSRPGMQRIFTRLGYRHLGWSDQKEIILFSFNNIHYTSEARKSTAHNHKDG